jgi:DNA-binding NarL/FixJ family response regulator
MYGKRHLRFGGMFVGFCVFAVACGTTLLMNVWSSWSPPPWLSAGIKVIAAIVAIPTAISEIVLQASFQAQKQAEQTKETEVRPTPREVQVVRLLAQRKSNKERASVLHISTRTVESYRARIMRKFKVKSTAEVIRYAIRNKIVEA